MRLRLVRLYHNFLEAFLNFLTFADPTSHVDNEYSRAGMQDPKIIVTTSRDPSSKLMQFAKVNVLFYTE